MLMNDIRFPNGPLSDSLDDQISFLSWNTEVLKNSAKGMGPTPERQQILVEYQNQVALLGNLIKKRTNLIRQKLDKHVQ